MWHWSILGFLKVHGQYTKRELIAEKEDPTESLVIYKHSVKCKLEIELHYMEI